MSPRHQAGRHPAFPLSHPAVAEEVVAVHHGQFAQEELDGALAPALLRTLALRRTQREKPGNSAVSAVTTAHAAGEPDPHLLQ